MKPSAADRFRVGLSVTAVGEPTYVSPHSWENIEDARIVADIETADVGTTQQLARWRISVMPSSQQGAQHSLEPTATMQTKSGFSPHRRHHAGSSLLTDFICASPARSVTIVCTLLLVVGWSVNSMLLFHDMDALQASNKLSQQNQAILVEKPLDKPPVHKQEASRPTAEPHVVQVTPTKEAWPMQEQFYKSSFPDDDTSTTIIFNLFKGPAEALKIQLQNAVAQEGIVPPEIWVMCFNSPMQSEYEAVVNSIRSATTSKSKIVLTVSDFNHKFHGRFLLAYMAKTKYVLIIDDDKNIDTTTVRDYIGYMKKRPGVWGNNGHVRATDFAGYRSWPMHYDTPEAEVDYLCGMWFLEQSWLEYFVKERMPSWETSEDMHLSHVMRKYLNLNTYGGRVAVNVPGLPSKKHAATVGSALDLREYIFDHQLGRGNKVADVDQPIDTLVYAETVDDINDFILKLESCASSATPSLRETPSVSPPWCTAGKVAAVFRGAVEQDTVGLIAAADRLCAKTQCEYLSVKPKIKHPIRYFNMREGYGQTSVDIPWQTSASDVLTSFVGVLNNIQPTQIFVPDVNDVYWDDPATSKQKRLEIYHDTIRLAIKIHRNSPINPKWQHRAAKAAFPTNVKAYAWRSGLATDAWTQSVTSI